MKKNQKLYLISDGNLFNIGIASNKKLAYDYSCELLKRINIKSKIYDPKRILVISTEPANKTEIKKSFDYFSFCKILTNYGRIVLYLRPAKPDNDDLAFESPSVEISLYQINCFYDEQYL